MSPLVRGSSAGLDATGSAHRVGPVPVLRSCRAQYGHEEAVDSMAMLLKAKTWLIKTLPFLARWGQNTTPNP
jgi:hypothetical protein